MSGTDDASSKSEANFFLILWQERNISFSIYYLISKTTLKDNSTSENWWHRLIKVDRDFNISRLLLDYLEKKKLLSVKLGCILSNVQSEDSWAMLFRGLSKVTKLEFPAQIRPWLVETAGRRGVRTRSRVGPATTAAMRERESGSSFSTGSAAASVE